MVSSVMAVGDKRYVCREPWDGAFFIEELTVVAISPNNRPAFQYKTIGSGKSRRKVPDYRDSITFASLEDCKAAKIAHLHDSIARLENELAARKLDLVEVQAIDTAMEARQRDPLHI